MSSTTATSIKRSPSSTPTLGTPPDTPRVVAEKAVTIDLSTREPDIKRELERWENIVFSFGMEGNNRRSSSQEHSGGRQSTNNPPSHQLPEGNIHPNIGGVPGFSVPWDIHPFFPTAQYGQQSPYDVLGLGAMNTIPSNPQTTGIPAQSQIQPLTPAEIAQYHALSTTQAPPEASASSSAPPSRVSPARGRSTSSAGEVQLRTNDAGILLHHIARFRVKKKQRTMELEKLLLSLKVEQMNSRRKQSNFEGRMAGSRRCYETAQAAKSSPGAGPSGSGSQNNSKDNDKSDDDADSGKEPVAYDPDGPPIYSPFIYHELESSRNKTWGIMEGAGK
ncbi:basic region leucine zipper protein [Rhizoctonia solani]|uniref:Basic region leucine zipper protein n=1 Tax=Rhizoctonia solani TaxID=456999 RepID=A0A8H8P4U8_9AGAM|nr:basic region leucine zipper protein [Rhizoctonia solani]QRW25285.1 basic region leucine zipper protein [Rhizoctonia solani]